MQILSLVNIQNCKELNAKWKHVTFDSLPVDLGPI